MPAVDELLAEVPVLAALAPAHRTAIAGCGHERVLEAGAYAMREGQPANAFHVIRHGSVAIETYVPQRGPQTIETLHEGDLLGWSWLFPPYRVAFDARAVGETEVIEFDGACLRGKLEQDPALGYALLRLFTNVIVERLQATRIRLLDLYGPVPVR